MNDEMKEKVDSLQNQLEELESEKNHIIKKLIVIKIKRCIVLPLKKE